MIYWNTCEVLLKQILVGYQRQLQLWTEYMMRSKEIKQNWSSKKTLIFFVSFVRY